MNRDTAQGEIYSCRREVLADGLIVCIRMGDRDLAARACRAVLAGGLRLLEITLTTPGALELIGEFGGDRRALVGAGTVLEVADVTAVAEAGGRFAMSPVFDPDVKRAADRAGLLYIPGAATPTEVRAAHRSGCDPVKVFPAAALGGPPYLRAILGPLTGVGVIPTNGPDSGNIAQYVAAGAVAVGVAPELFPPGWTEEQASAAAHRTREAMDRARGAD